MYLAGNGFRIEQVRAPAALAALPPDLRGLLGDMARVSGASESFAPRSYQLALLKSGVFRLNDALTSAASVIIDDKSVLYFLQESTRFAVIASCLAEGFPLLGLVDLAGAVCYNAGDPNWGVRVEHLVKFARALPVNLACHSPPQSRIAVTGDANFAHVVWNQLAALDEGFRIAGHDGLPVIATHEPLGPLEEIIGRLRSSRVIRLPDFELATLNDPGAKSFVTLGSVLVERRLRRDLVARFIARGEPQAAALRGTLAGSKIVILTLRSRTRTATNLIAVLAAISHRLLAANPGLQIVLDGHSLPADFASNRSYDRRHHAGLVAADTQTAAAICAEVAHLGGAAGRIHPAIGWDVRDSIAVGALGQFYFAHHGTVQHKIAWFHDMPGLVHSNASTIALNPAGWVGDQVEGGVRPVYLPAHFVQDGDPVAPADSRVGSLRHENYTIGDVQAVADLVARLAAPHLG